MSVDTFLAEYDCETTPLLQDVPEVRSRLYGRGVGPYGWSVGVELDLIPKDAGGDAYIYLAFIGTHERGKGRGSAALTWLCDLADRHGVTIAGHADSTMRTLRDFPSKPAQTGSTSVRWCHGPDQSQSGESRGSA